MSLVDELAEIRLLELIEAAAAILRRIVPAVRRGADEAARQDAVAEIDPVIGDHLIDDRRQLAPGAGAFELQAMLGPIEVVDDGLEDAEKDHVDARACCRCISQASISRACRP